MNIAFALLILGAVMTAALSGVDGAAIGRAALDGARKAAEVAIGLCGAIVFFTGMLAIVERAGGLRWLAQALRPVLRRLFPEVAGDDAALGAIVLNFSANFLGLGNAATPFGLQAMQRLRQLSPHGDAASDAMCLFLAINTSGLAVLPTDLLALRATHGARDPAAILPAIWLATGTSTAVAVAASWFLRRRWSPAPLAPEPASSDAAPAPTPDAHLPGAAEPALVGRTSTAIDPAPPGSAGAADALADAEGNVGRWRAPALLAALAAMMVAALVVGDGFTGWLLPGLIAAIVAAGLWRKVPVYEAFLAGGRQGLQAVLGILAPLVGVLAAVAMLRASGAVEGLVSVVGPLVRPLGVEPEVLPVALLRPLSGSGAFGFCSELLARHGPDSAIGLQAVTLAGSSDTTFYILAVYFGAVGVRRGRWALAAGLCADASGAIAAIVASHLFLL